MKQMALTLLLSLILLSVKAQADLEVVSYSAGEFVAGEDGETVRPGDRISAALGVKFGLRFKLSGKTSEANIVKMLYLTPGIIDAQGTRHDKFEIVRDLDIDATSHSMAFEFTEPFEVVRGSWQMMVFEDDRLLLKHNFQVGEIEVNDMSATPASKPSIRDFNSGGAEQSD